MAIGGQLVEGDIAVGSLSEAMTVKNCLGVGSTLEGLTVNPVAYDLLLEQPWHQDAAVDLTSWVADYATRRAGRADSAARARGALPVPQPGAGVKRRESVGDGRR